MYMFVVVAVLAAGLWMAFERPLLKASSLYARFGTLSFGIFILATSVFWLFSPGLTARLVPGESGGTLVAVATQARAIVGIGLGLIALGGRRIDPRAWCSVIAAPMVYNLVMSTEALAAQFTVLSTAERWLYVCAHFLWSMAFALRLIGTPSANAAAFTARRVGCGVVSAALILLTVAGLGAGLALFALPYDFMVPALPIGASTFLAHALHGFGSANLAVALVAFAIWAGEPRERPLGRVALLLICIGYAGLSLYRASQMGSLQAWVRELALLSTLSAAALAFGGGWNTKGEDDAKQ